jgi:hypothetical protein
MSLQWTSPRPPGPTGASASEAFPAGPGRPPRQEREDLRMRLDAVLGHVLEAEETVVLTVVGVEEPSVLEIVAVGSLTWFMRRVALVLTTHRLLELALDWRARRALGRVRAVRLAETTAIELQGATLSLRAASRHRWWIARARDRAALEGALALVQGTLGAASPGGLLTVCERCGAQRPGDADCRACGAPRRSRSLATWLALGLPGSGIAFARHPVLAVAHCLFETGMWWFMIERLLAADSGTEQIAMAAVLPPVAVLVKVESVALSRLLTARTGTIEAARLRWWRRLVVPGLAAMLLALVLGVAFTGQGGSEVNADLDIPASASDPGWTCNRDPEAWEDAALWDDARCECRQQAGLLVVVRAEPLRPFEPPEEGVRRVCATPGVRALGEPIVLRLGPHGVWRVRSAPRTGDWVTLTYAVLDRRHRDVHLLVATAPTEEADATVAAMERLIRRAIWIKPPQPAKRQRT